MLDFEDDASRREKCYTTVAQLPAFVDPKQPPTKKSPFSAILSHPFVHTVQIILPKKVYSAIEDSLNEKTQRLRYARVFMPLSSLLEGDFFNTYIKSGNILMISEGRPGLDNVFTLRDGVLKLELGKESYEKTGLTGKPVRSGGRKHKQERFVVEINLRLPSMLHGKKGFERIERAFKNVLNSSVAWLFYDLESESNGMAKENAPIEKHQPQIIECEPVKISHDNIIVPSIQEMSMTEATSEVDLQDYCGTISEWLAMVALESPRVSADDDIDPYLSRYSIDGAASSDFISLKWHGFIPPNWIMQLFTGLLRETTSKVAPASAWFALSSNAMGKDAVEGKDGYTIMTLPPPGCSLNAHDDTSGNSEAGGRFICWEFIGASI